MSELASREIELTKIVDAPHDLVFAAFTDADHLVKWWGPEGFDCSSATSDPAPGGAFTIVMRAPDRNETPVEGRYLVLESPHHLVAEITSVGSDGTPMIEGTTTVHLVDLDGKTEIRLQARARALVPDANPALGGMELGWTSSLRCLDDHLTGAVGRQIVLMRMLEASPERAFEVWTTPEHVAAWFGPAGFTLTTDSMDVRPGGEWIFTMHGPDGVDYPNRVIYEVVDPPSMLVFLHEGLSDDVDPPFRQTVMFDPFMGGTLITMKGVWDTTEDRDRTVEKYGAIEGGEQTLERLAAYVSGN